MKTTQYVRLERAIAAADTSGIRERIMWAIRLLSDPDVFTSGGQMKAGRADELVQAIKAAGRKISQREIQYRIRAARTYPTESQIAQISARFENWSSLIAADFPAVDAFPGDSPIDHRTDAERERDLKRAYESILGEQGELFPLSDFEPSTVTLKTLVDYADEMEEWTGRRVAHDRKRREYLDGLVAAVGDDLSVTWLEAQRRANGGTA